MPRVPDWQLRCILPSLVAVSRMSPVRNVQLEATIRAMTGLARRRGLDMLLAEIERDHERYLQPVPISTRNDEGPPEEGPSRAATTAAEE